MPALEQLIPLYLTACTVEGKTERTVQSYAETLRHFRRAVDQLQLPNSVRAFRPVLSELRAFQARRQADSEAGPGLGGQLRHQG